MENHYIDYLYELYLARTLFINFYASKIYYFHLQYNAKSTMS